MHSVSKQSQPLLPPLTLWYKTTLLITLLIQVAEFCTKNTQMTQMNDAMVYNIWVWGTY